MKTRTNRLSIPALLIGVAISISACGGKPDAATVDRTPSRTVQFQTARASSAVGVQTFAGSIEGVRRVPLSTRVMGRVVQLDVDEGDQVGEGDTLLRIDDGQLTAQRRQAEAGLREASAHLENARANFARFETLLERGSATEREFDDAQTGLRSAEARVSSLESRLTEIDDALGYTVIRSPVSGVIAVRSIEQGAMAAPGAPLLIVETIDRLKVLAHVPENAVNGLSAGQEVRIHVDAAGVVAHGVIAEINRTASGPGRRYSMRVLFDGGTDGIRPGMFARVSVKTGASGAAITVPEQAVIRRGQLTGLYTLTDNDRVMLRWVRPGRSADGRVEILSGLSDGERYVIPDGERLEDGQFVDVRPNLSSSAAQTTPDVNPTTTQ